MSHYGRHSVHRAPLLPHLGQRIVKTSIAVFICFIIYLLNGRRGMVGEAVITAIICMQPYVSDSRTYSLNRIIGTIVGALWALLLLLLFKAIPVIRLGMWAVYLMISVFTMLALYSCIVLHRADTASLAAIVFLCIVMDYPDIVETPVMHVLERLITTLIGTVVAVSVNVFSLPRRRHPDRLFFISNKSLAPDRFSPVPGSVLVWLNRLYSDGAKICLVSEHAPAFFLQQMGTVNVNTPVIVMDGAALFNAEQHKYERVVYLGHERYRFVMDLLEKLQLNSYIYSVDNNSLLISHYGTPTESENMVYKFMRRTPYRNYVDELPMNEDKVVLFKLIDTDENIARIEDTLELFLPVSRFRIISRPQTGFEGLSAIYIYPVEASINRMKKHLRECFENGEKLIFTDMTDGAGYVSERDSLALLARIRKIYEPVDFRALLPGSRKGAHTGENEK